MAGMTRRGLLGAGLAGCLLPRRSWAAPRPARRLITVIADGGWDVTYAFDPKQGVHTVDGPELDEDASDPDDREVVRRFGDISITTNAARRPAVTTFFERWGEHAAVLNGIAVDSLGHGSARQRVLTGSSRNNRPDLGAITGASWGTDLALGYLDSAGLGLPAELAASAGSIGHLGQLEMLLDRSKSWLASPEIGSDYPQLTLDRSEEEAISEYLAQRAEAVRSARSGGGGHTQLRLNSYDEARVRAERLAASPMADSLRFGRSSSLADLSDLAADLLSQDVCASVLLDSGAQWDSHTNNIDQHEAYELTFSALSTLMTALDAASLLDSTLVVVVSEMTRAAKRNEDDGKDHWPVTSAMLLGAGVQGGRLLGGTTDLLDARRVDPVTGTPDDNGMTLDYRSFAAGVLQALDVDPEAWLPGITPFAAWQA